MSKIIHLLSYITIGLAFAVILYIIYYMYYPFKVIDIKNSPYPVLTKQVEKDGVLIFHADFCKYMDVDTQTTTKFANNLVFTQGARTISSPVGCSKVNVAVDIPHTLPAGVYTYKIVSRYKVHPVLRTITVRAETERFEIIDGKTSKDNK